MDATDFRQTPVTFRFFPIKTLTLLVVWFFVGSVLCALVPVQLKNLVHVEGMRDNILLGYGLVVGLNGTGDSLRASPFTRTSMVGMLSRLGVGLTGDASKQLSTKNVAAVAVTAKLPPFSRQGNTIDVTVSTLGDARSLRGGTLLVTPLLAADGQVYAVAQGLLATNSFQAQGTANQQGGVGATTSVTKGVPTKAMIPGGAIVEREVPFRFSKLSKLNLSLKRPDFTTAKRIEQVINQNFPGFAQAVDPSTVLLKVPKHLRKHTLGMLSQVEKLYVVPDGMARVLLNESEGVVVMDKNVRIDTVAVSHGNLTVRIDESFNVSQPPPMAGFGQTVNVNQNAEGGDEGGGASNTANIDPNILGQGPVVTTQTDLNVQESKNKMGIIQETGNLRDLVDGLNAFNLPASDLSAVLRTIHAAGAMHANLEIR